MNNTTYNSIDHTKCLLIIAVILCHIIHFGELYPTTQDAILMIVNPTFFIITGYLVNINKTKKEFAVYLIRIIIPYIIMSVGYGILSVYLPVRDGMTDCRLSSLLHVLTVAPIGPYWYFHTMIICTFLYYLSFRTGKWGKAGSFMLYAALLLFCVEYAHLISLRFACCFYIGAAIRLSGMKLETFYQPSYLAIIPFMLLLPGIPSHWSDFTVIALASCFLCFYFRLVKDQKGKYMNLMGYIGRNTFPIYIFHPIFTMISKYTLGAFTFDPTGLAHTVFTVILCVAGSLGIARIMDQTHLSYGFGRKSILR